MQWGLGGSGDAAGSAQPKGFKEVQKISWWPVFFSCVLTPEVSHFLPK